MQNLQISKNISIIGNNPYVIPCKYITYEKKNVKYENYDISQNNDNLPIFNESELADSIIKNKIFLLRAPYCILVYSNTMIKEILDSYKCDQNYLSYDNKCTILKQISLDFPRMKLHYNSILCKNEDELYSSIQYFNKYFYGSISLFFIILVLCTQATFSYPFNFINSIYTIEKSNIYVLPLNDYPYINIIDNTNYINIILKKSFHLVDINSKKIFNKFHTFFIITIDLHEEPDGFILYGKKYCEFRDSIFYLIKI